MPATPLTRRGKVIVVFATVHLVFLLFGVLPVRWRERIHATTMFSMYERITRCHQLWNMFETIPNMHRLEARLIIQEGAQKPRAAGMVLPGLQKFSQHEQVRLNNWVANVVFNPTRGVFRESYMRSAAAALLRTGRYGPETELSLEVIPAYTRSLLGVRTLKEIAVESPSVLGPFKLGALVAKDPANSVTP